MKMSEYYTRHALVRAQQRGIPTFVDDLLNQFGEESFDGHGCVRIVLTEKSLRKIERIRGNDKAKQCSRYRGVYKVESMYGGTVITVGRLYRRRRRR